MSKNSSNPTGSNFTVDRIAMYTTDFIPDSEDSNSIMAVSSLTYARILSVIQSLQDRGEHPKLFKLWKTPDEFSHISSHEAAAVYIFERLPEELLPLTLILEKTFTMFEATFSSSGHNFSLPHDLWEEKEREESDRGMEFAKTTDIPSVWKEYLPEQVLNDSEHHHMYKKLYRRYVTQADADGQKKKQRYISIEIALGTCTGLKLSTVGDGIYMDMEEWRKERDKETDFHVWKVQEDQA
ncbi:hypothetical protein WISP_113973 [Willisornis vidua]|uniref:Uncharacterized protein n=1 Tax=Willisornis vidua TaxID=1566151 RepID=A0ABQ9D038_9PASS|nr:hypothetical protein WISP_113973 [Willisornis vidua]